MVDSRQLTFADKLKSRLQCLQNGFNNAYDKKDIESVNSNNLPPKIISNGFRRKGVKVLLPKNFTYQKIQDNKDLPITSNNNSDIISLTTLPPDVNYVAVKTLLNEQLFASLRFYETDSYKDQKYSEYVRLNDFKSYIKHVKLINLSINEYKILYKNLSVKFCTCTMQQLLSIKNVYYETGNNLFSNPAHYNDCAMSDSRILIIVSSAIKLCEKIIHQQSKKVETFFENMTNTNENFPHLTDLNQKTSKKPLTLNVNGKKNVILPIPKQDGDKERLSNNLSMTEIKLLPKHSQKIPCLIRTVDGKVFISIFDLAQLFPAVDLETIKDLCKHYKYKCAKVKISKHTQKLVYDRGEVKQDGEYITYRQAKKLGRKLLAMQVEPGYCAENTSLVCKSYLSPSNFDFKHEDIVETKLAPLDGTQHINDRMKELLKKDSCTDLILPKLSTTLLNKMKSRRSIKIIRVHLTYQHCKHLIGQRVKWYIAKFAFRRKKRQFHKEKNTFMQKSIKYSLLSDISPCVIDHLEFNLIQDYSSDLLTNEIYMHNLSKVNMFLLPCIILAEQSFPIPLYANAWFGSPKSRVSKILPTNNNMALDISTMISTKPSISKTTQSQQWQSDIGPYSFHTVQKGFLYPHLYQGSMTAPCVKCNNCDRFFAPIHFLDCHQFAHNLYQLSTQNSVLAHTIKRMQHLTCNSPQYTHKIKKFYRKNVLTTWFSPATDYNRQHFSYELHWQNFIEKFTHSLWEEEQAKFCKLQLQQTSWNHRAMEYHFVKHWQDPITEIKNTSGYRAISKLQTVQNLYSGPQRLSKRFKVYNSSLQKLECLNPTTAQKKSRNSIPQRNILVKYPLGTLPNYLHHEIDRYMKHSIQELITSKPNIDRYNKPNFNNPNFNNIYEKYRILQQNIHSKF